MRDTGRFDYLEKISDCGSRARRDRQKVQSAQCSARIFWLHIEFSLASNRKAFKGEKRMAKIGGSYSSDTPYGCAAKKHFASYYIPEPCPMCVPTSGFCITGRHHHRIQAQVASSECCKPFIIDGQALLKESVHKNNQLPHLNESIDKLTSKIQGYRDLKQGLEEKLAKNRAARSHALSRGEVPPADSETVCARDDIIALESHIARESDALRKLIDQRASINVRLLWIEGQLELAEKIKARDAIYVEMLELINGWNVCVRKIIKMRQETKMSTDRPDLNRGFFPLLPPGLTERGPEASPRVFCLEPRMNITQEKILAWKVPETD